MSNVVKYSNDFNFLPMPKLTEREMDIFIKVIAKIKEDRFVEFDEGFFSDMLGYKESYSDVIKIFNNFADKILNFKIKYQSKEKMYAFVCFERLSFDLKTRKVEITAQTDFHELITNYNLGFTKFEIVEFMELSGKYTKILYRLLKQYKDTGAVLTFKNDWEKFCELMQIPENYNHSKIDERILKPAIKELSLKNRAFNKNKPIFQNLTYKKIKIKNGKGQGGSVVGIEFYFDPIKADELEPDFKNKTKPIVIHERITFQTKEERNEYLKEKANSVINNKSKNNKRLQKSE